MKILYTDQTGKLGGGELSLFDAITRLPYEAAAVLFSDGPLRGKLEAANVKVIVADSGGLATVRTDSGLLRSLAAIPSAFRLIRLVSREAKDCDVIYANSLKAFVISAIAAKWTKRRLVWHLRDILTTKLYGRLQQKLVVWLGNNCADVIIANSRATATALVQLGGLETKIRVVHNGIPADRFSSSSRDALEAVAIELEKKSSGFTQGPIVGIFGRLTPWKGQHLLLRALAELPDVRAVIVGGALFGDDASFRDSLEQQIDALALKKRVLVLGDREDVPALMQTCTAIAHCSIEPEPFGRVIVEAMLSRKPVIAAGAGGVVEIVRHNETGLLFSPGNVVELGQMIRKATQDPQTANHLANAGYEYAKSHFSIEGHISALTSILDGAPFNRVESKAPPRVLFIDHTAAFGGAELCMLDLVKRLPVTPHVFLLEDGPLNEALAKLHIPVILTRLHENLHGLRTNTGTMQAILNAPAILRSVLEVADCAKAFDVIYANSLKSFVISSIAGVIARRRVIWHLHDILTAPHFGAPQKRLLVFLGNRFASRIIANSRASALAFESLGGRHDLITVIHNGIDPAEHQGLTGAASEAARKSLAPHGEARCLVGMFGRIAEWKGQHIFLKALAQVPEAVGVIVGSALFEGDISYGKSLAKLVDELDLRSRVHFIGFQRDVDELMGAMDIIVHCSVSPEPFGRVIIEAMLARKPIIASNAGGVTEIIANQRNGLLTAPADANELAAALKALIASSELRQKLSDCAYDDVRKHFDLAKIAAATTATIKEVLAERRD